MDRRMREIVALGLLAVLGIATVCAMGWYILAGHGWNITASNIDDSIGRMEGYTVVLLEGTRQRPLDGEDAVADPQIADEDAQAPLGEELDPDVSAEVEAVAEELLEEGPADISELCRSYAEKGAEVYQVALSDVQRYRDPMVVSKGDRRLGLCLLDSPSRPAQARVAKKLLDRLQADFKILITPDASLEGAMLPGVDVIICNKPEGEVSKGHYANSVFWMDAPYIGEVEALIISPSGVLSTKTIGAA